MSVVFVVIGGVGDRRVVGFRGYRALQAASNYVGNLWSRRKVVKCKTTRSFMEVCLEYKLLNKVWKFVSFFIFAFPFYGYMCTSAYGCKICIAVVRRFLKPQQTNKQAHLSGKMKWWDSTQVAQVAPYAIYIKRTTFTATALVCGTSE